MTPLSRAGRSRLVQAEHPTLLLDLDGTLAPLVDQPDRARVPRTTQAILRRLRRDGARIVLVTGRSIPGARRVLGMAVDAIIGDHGGRAMIAGRIEPWLVFRPAPLERAVRAVARHLDGRPGVILERKDRSLAIHLRLSPREAPAVTRDLVALLQDLGLRVLRGHRVLDAQLPGIDKGRAVRKWLAAYPAEAVLYAGDDTTDQDAFRALRGKAMTIAVGPRPIRAQYRTPTPESFARWLGRLARERHARHQ